MCLVTIVEKGHIVPNCKSKAQETTKTWFQTTQVHFVCYGKQYIINGYYLYDQTSCRFSIIIMLHLMNFYLFLFNLWKFLNPHHHLKIMCMMLPRNGFHLYHFRVKACLSGSKAAFENP
jgi:hypothetical protein